MPLYRLVDKKTNKVLSVRRMGYETAEYFNKNEVEEGTEWLKGLGETVNYKPTRSLNKLMQDMDTEGFNSHSMNVIESFLDQEAKEKLRDRESYHTAREKYVDVVKDMSFEERRAISRFFKMQCAHSFHAGIQLGLTGRLFEED